MLPKNLCYIFGSWPLRVAVQTAVVLCADALPPVALALGHCSSSISRKSERRRRRFDGIYTGCLRHGSTFQRCKTCFARGAEVLSLRFKLTRAWGILKAWKLRLPSAHRLPLPLNLLQLMFSVALDAHLAGTRSALLLPLAVLMRVGFFGLLRPAELLRLRVADIYVGATSEGAPTAVAILKAPKNKATMGMNQFATISDPGTVVWLGWLIQGLPADANIWPSSTATFGQLFRWVLGVAGLSHLPVTPGCLRPGGTTFYYLEGRDIARLQFMGRWASASSLSSYVQESMAHMVWISLEPAARSRIAEAVSASIHIWRSPPSCGPSACGALPLGWRRLLKTSHASSPPAR